MNLLRNFVFDWHCVLSNVTLYILFVHKTPWISLYSIHVLESKFLLRIPLDRRFVNIFIHSILLNVETRSSINCRRIITIFLPKFVLVKSDSNTLTRKAGIPRQMGVLVTVPALVSDGVFVHRTMGCVSCDLVTNGLYSLIILTSHQTHSNGKFYKNS